MVLYRSSNGGSTWDFSELGSHYGEMYPALLRLRDGRLLLTFTMRTAVPPNEAPPGVRTVLVKETPDGSQFDFGRDRIVISDKTSVGTQSCGSFGPTVQLDDGTLVTAYSYPTAEEDGRYSHVEVVRWKLD